MTEEELRKAWQRELEPKSERVNGRPDIVWQAIQSELTKRKELTTGDLVTFLDVRHAMKTDARTLSNALNNRRKAGQLKTRKGPDRIALWRLA